MEMLNPMHRFWSDGRWNKITLAHGCYWKKCSFCDVSLDYIGRYDRPGEDIVMQRIRALIAETDETGFHLVDEAAPPAGMRALAERLIDEKLSITWWGNIRFEKTFTPELCRLLAAAGCVAVSGGLEVASDRLLKLMKKGVTVEQVARVTRAFSDAGIMVHAYLMYGFPTETDAGHGRRTRTRAPALCRRLHPVCVLASLRSDRPLAHRPAAARHTASPCGRRQSVTFAHNDIEFDDPVGTDHDHLGGGLRKALYNYMHGVGLDADVREWFEPRPVRRGRARPGGGRAPRPSVPVTTVPPDLIERFLG